MTEHLEAALQNLHAYPRWLVASCVVIVALAALWVLGKLLKWTLYVVVALAALAVIAGGVWWFLGQG